jgi:hypothetical protein
LRGEATAGAGSFGEGAGWGEDGEDGEDGEEGEEGEARGGSGEAARPSGDAAGPEIEGEEALSQAASGPKESAARAMRPRWRRRRVIMVPSKNAQRTRPHSTAERGRRARLSACSREQKRPITRERPARGEA